MGVGCAVITTKGGWVLRQLSVNDRFFCSSYIPDEVAKNSQKNQDNFFKAHPQSTVVLLAE